MCSKGKPGSPFPANEAPSSTEPVQLVTFGSWPQYNNFKIVEVFFYVFFFLFGFLLFFCSQSHKWVVLSLYEVSAFRVRRSMSPSINLWEAKKETSRGTVFAPSGPFGFLLDLRASELMQAQSFQSALCRSATPLTLLPAHLHSSPSFPLKHSMQGSWTTGLISSKGMSGAHSGALRMRWSFFIAL